MSNQRNSPLELFAESQIEDFRVLAKAESKYFGKTYLKCLDEIARKHQYKDWASLMREGQSGKKTKMSTVLGREIQIIGLPLRHVQIMDPCFEALKVILLTGIVRKSYRGCVYAELERDYQSETSRILIWELAKKEGGVRHLSRKDLKLRATIEEDFQGKRNPQFEKFMSPLEAIECSFTLPPGLSKQVLERDYSFDDISRRIDFYLSVKVKGTTIAEIIKSAPTHTAGYQIEKSSISEIFEEILNRIHTRPSLKAKLYLIEG